MRLEGIEDFYSTQRSPLESGYRRLDDGTLLVAALHRLPRCTWEMFDWWLSTPKTQELFVRWHPRDHISIDGEIVRQRIGGRETVGRVRSVEPSDFLDMERLRAAGMAGARASRAGPADADFTASVFIHVCRDTDLGLEVRTRFWQGATDPPGRLDAAARRKIFPEGFGAALLQHTLEEYAYLSGFLPKVYLEAVSGLGSDVS